MAFYLKQDRDMLMQENSLVEEHMSLLKKLGAKLGFYKKQNDVLND